MKTISAARRVVRLKRVDAVETKLRTAMGVHAHTAPAADPSLSTSGETLTIEESMNLEGESGERRNVGVEHEWDCGRCWRRPRRPTSRRRAGIRDRRARRAGGGAWPRAGRAGQAPLVDGEVQAGDPGQGGRVHEAGRGRRAAAP